MATCQICNAFDAKLDVRHCVACGKAACPSCRGDEGSDYWSHSGKKGYACVGCIHGSQAYEGGPLAIGREIKAHVHAVLLPEVLAAVDERLAKVRDEIVPPIVDTALTRVEKLTVNTLHEAEGTTSRLVARLETAIGTQRVEVKTDVKEVIEALAVSLRPVLIWVAVMIGIVNLAGIAVAVLLTRALSR